MPKKPAAKKRQSSPLSAAAGRSIAEHAKRSGYSSPEKVVSVALRLLRDEERRQREYRAEMDAIITEGLAAADRGDLHDGPAFMRELRAKVRRKKAS